MMYRLALPILLRFGIPMLLAIASAAIFFRMLILLLLGITFTGLFMAAIRMINNISKKRPQSTKDDGTIIDSKYRVVDNPEDHST